MARPLIEAVAAIVAGALLLSWPIILNGYPIVFSDTGALLDMGFLPSMGWDKPFAYGPFAALTSLGQSLVLTAAVQYTLLSYALWATQAAFARPAAARHVLVCRILALATACPWFAGTLLPDAFTPIVALGILTALGHLPRPHRLAITVLTAVAIATHLSHLVLAASLIACLALGRWRIPWRPLTSLAAALLFLLATNLVGYGRLAISPYGSVFALARLIADGPARDYLDRVCPDPALALCQSRADLTDDSDQFLWDAKSPFWTLPLPLADFAAQASTIVAGTLRTEPVRVARIAVRNALAEITHPDLGDTLGADYLADTVRPRIQRFLPAAELARYDAARQPAGTLAPLAAAMLPLQRAVLVAAFAGCAALLVAGLRRPTPRTDLACLVVLALAANAFATGALSAIHDRYEARLVWILLLPCLLSVTAPARPPRSRSAARP